MLSKVWEIIQTYSNLMGFELPSLNGFHSSVPMKKNTHLGFDIVNNKIENVKYDRLSSQVQHNQRKNF